jgi:hypothetical protein
VRGGRTSKDLSNVMRRVDKEMDAAVAKLGPIHMPDTSHVQDFFNKVDKNK